MKFRKATIEDAKRLFEWRNDALTRADSIQTEPVIWENHLEWLTKSLKNRNRILLIVEDLLARDAQARENPVGTVRIDIHENGENELSWTVAPEARGRGIGKQIVRQIVQEHGKKLIAKIKEGNIASEKIASHAGFVCLSREDGLSEWEYNPARFNK